MAGGDHYLVNLIDLVQPLHIHPEQAVAGGGQLDLPLFGFGSFHSLPLAHLPENLRRLVFMVNRIVLLPHVELVLSHAQQHRDIFLPHNMSFSEPGSFGHSRDDLGHIVTEYLSHGLLCFY